MALKDIFDMMAGTSTGSILVSGLAYPDKNYRNISKPQFFADDLLKIYTERGGEIFVQQGLRSTYYFLFIILFVVVFSACGYLLGNMLFDSPRTRRAFKEMKQMVENDKKKTKYRLKQKFAMIVKKIGEGEEVSI